MRSLSLKAYQALVRGSATPSGAPRTARPDGTLVWIIVQDEASFRAALYLHDRIAHLRGACHLLISTSDQMPGAYLCDPLPADTGPATQAFLDHWQPDLCIWMNGNLQPVLISETKARAVPMMLIGAAAEFLEQGLWRWVPSLARETLLSFDYTSAGSQEAARLMRRVLPGKSNIDVHPPLQIASPPPPVNVDALEELTDMHLAAAIPMRRQHLERP